MQSPTTLPAAMIAVKATIVNMTTSVNGTTYYFPLYALGPSLAKVYKTMLQAYCQY